jgi:hypothetical protein
METHQNQERPAEPFSPTFTPNPPQVMNPSIRPEKNFSVLVNTIDDKSKNKRKKETVATTEHKE